MESNLCVVETHIYLCRCVQGYGTCECTCVEARGDARGLPPASLTLFIEIGSLTQKLIHMMRLSDHQALAKGLHGCAAVLGFRWVLRNLLLEAEAGRSL